MPSRELRLQWFCLVGGAASAVVPVRVHYEIGGKK